MDKLNFLTAGLPICSKDKGYKGGFEDLTKLGLDGMELEFVHGVRISEESINIVKAESKTRNLVTTAHGPYYINLNAKEPEKTQASIQRILETARTAQKFGAFSITYHAAFYLGMDKKEVYKTVKKTTEIIIKTLEEEKIKIWIRPETTGKSSQWGDLEEICSLSKEFEQVLPCVDFSHLHARTNGLYNTYDEFARILDYISKQLGQRAIDNFHAHLAGIEYGPKGEKRHLELEQSDMNYKDLLKALKEFNVKGALVCESPNIEKDAALLKKYYLSL